MKWCDEWLLLTYLSRTFECGLLLLQKVKNTQPMKVFCFSSFNTKLNSGVMESTLRICIFLIFLLTKLHMSYFA